MALAHELDFDCVVAGTAEEALALASELRPNGILLDIGLPDVSGLSVLERLKRNLTPGTSRCMWSRQRTAARWRASWARSVLRSPTTRERLVTAIEQLEQTSQRDVRRLLIVEDDSELRRNLNCCWAAISCRSSRWAPWPVHWNSSARSRSIAW